ncbi:MAG: integrase [Mannheimia varigena]|nr:integrase [Mannheimia varigena]
MATILKNGKKWRAQVRRKGVNKSKTFLTKSEAVSWGQWLESQIEAGEYNTIPSITFSDLIDKYLKEETILKGGAREERYRLLRVSRSFLGEIMLPDLSKEHFKKWQNQRLQEVQPNSVIRHNPFAASNLFLSLLFPLSYM